MFRKLKRWFLSGLAVIAPVGVTLFILFKIFEILDGILSKAIVSIFGEKIPGVGLVAIILLILIIGMATSNIFGKRIFGWIQKIISKIPIVKIVYKPIQKIVSAFSNDKSKSFQKVVLVEFPMKGMQNIGFITNDNVSIEGSDKICVFIPTTPNPTNGYLVVMDYEKVVELDISVSEGLNYVISIGSIMHGDLKTLKPSVKPTKS
jgi:uncharacterized membrane protein